MTTDDPRSTRSVHGHARPVDHRIGKGTGMAPLIVVIALLGLAIGSFLNVVIHRVPANESLVRPPSHCPACGHRIRNRHNVPVLGWLVLRGGAPTAAPDQRAVSAGRTGDRGAVRRGGAAVRGPASAGRAAGLAVLHGDGNQPGHHRSGRRPAAQRHRLPVLPGAGERCWRWPRWPSTMRRRCYGPASAPPCCSWPFSPWRTSIRPGWGSATSSWPESSAAYWVSSPTPCWRGCVRGVRHRLDCRDRKDCRPSGTARSAIAFGPFMIAGALLALFVGSAVTELYLRGLDQLAGQLAHEVVHQEDRQRQAEAVCAIQMGQNVPFRPGVDEQLSAAGSASPGSARSAARRRARTAAGRRGTSARRTRRPPCRRC